MIRRTRVLMAAAATLTVLTVPQASLFAQGNTALSGLAGRKVRLTIAQNDGGQILIQGTAFDVQGDTINVLQSGGGQSSRVALSSIQSLMVSTGKDRWGGAIKGAAIGGGVFLIMSLVTGVDCDGSGYGYDCKTDGSSPSTAEYVGESVAGGALFGAMVGAWIGTERWESVITPKRITIAPARGGGIRVGLSF